jgi:triosephosphate isomerase (TIM)
MTRRKMIAGNWKMNLRHDQAVALAESITRNVGESQCEVALFPAFPWIVPVAKLAHDTAVRVGAQDCHWEESGAYTGEVSAAMLADFCQYILAGHSERRHLFGESDATVGRKVTAIMESRSHAVLCVGETLEERQSGQAAATVQRQLASGLEAVSGEHIQRLTIAYEPVWAIGTGVSATPADAQEMCAMIRSSLGQRYGDAGREVRVLYGGSMTPENARELLSQADVDGGLIGGASLKPESFLQIIAEADATTAM